MSQDQLEELFDKCRALYVKSGFKKLSDEAVKVLFMYEMWKDGADWETVMEIDREGVDRMGHIFSLKEVFSYG